MNRWDHDYNTALGPAPSIATSFRLTAQYLGWHRLKKAGIGRVMQPHANPNLIFSPTTKRSSLARKTMVRPINLIFPLSIPYKPASPRSSFATEDGSL